jgi:hypothetical protein
MPWSHEGDRHSPKAVILYDFFNADPAARMKRLKGGWCGAIAEGGIFIDGEGVGFVVEFPFQRHREIVDGGDFAFCMALPKTVWCSRICFTNCGFICRIRSADTVLLLLVSPRTLMVSPT